KPKWGPKEDPHSAAFQWNEALKDEENLRKKDRAYPKDPTLRLRLAEARVHLGPQDAEYFLEAANLYLSQGRPSGAHDVLLRTKDLVGAGQVTLMEGQNLERLLTVARRTRDMPVRAELAASSRVQALAVADDGGRLILGDPKRI